MSTPSNGALRVGELRPSQLLHTYGVGAVADLPNLSTMVLGLDHWELVQATQLTEDRLLAAVRRRLGSQVTTLRTPPQMQESSDPFGEWTRVGVPVALFPRWLRCSREQCNQLSPASSGLFELEEHVYRPENTRYVHTCFGTGRRRPTAVPARFLIACPDGHMDDFPWQYFVHRGGKTAHDCTLSLVERGTTGEAANIFVQCSCPNVADRSMAEAMGKRGEQELPACRGHHPHLGTFEACSEKVRTIALGATNSWFASQLRVFSLPRADEPLTQAVREHWRLLAPLAPVPAEAAKMLLPTQSCWPMLEEYGVDRVWKAVTDEAASAAAPSGGPVPDDEGFDLATPEWEAFTAPHRYELPDFTTEPEKVPTTAAPWLERVILVHRLREVSALTGFTRIDAPEWLPLDHDDDPVVKAASLSKEPPTWVPCAELRGEGVFLAFQEERLDEWEKRHDVIAREKVLKAAHVTWCLARGLDPQWPGIRYVLLHTFAHVLIRGFALECGYGASGIAERVYARSGKNPMAGILLYTAAPDSEGTLGGLVSLGRRDRLGPVMEQAVEEARLCSSDPMCAEHDPRVHGRLHGAACHACLFAAETSCERGNHYLDRALLVATLAGDLGAFLS
ncbi:DrmB family protein [Streptomyces sp. NPDC060030]|uniref:DrmB family protein n=1 Tax=Streptomyces sp. NPDC060030 TaxID=3347042 RepID=UPI0036ADE01E